MSRRGLIARVCLSSVLILLGIAWFLVPVEIEPIVFIGAMTVGVAVVILSIGRLVNIRESKAPHGSQVVPTTTDGNRLAAKNQATAFAVILLIVGVVMLCGGLALGGAFAVAGIVAGGFLAVVAVAIGVLIRAQGRTTSSPEQTPPSK